MTSASAASSAAFRGRRVDDRDDQVGPLREQRIELDLLLAPRERARQELAAVGVDGDVARDVAAGEDRRDEKGGNDHPGVAGRQAHDPRDRGDEWGAVSFTMRPGWRTWFAAGVNLDDYARRRRIFVATLNCAAFLSRNACSVVIRGK